MAYDNFFGDIDNCLGVSPFGVRRDTIPAGAGPTIFAPDGTFQVSIAVFDIVIRSTAAPAGANTMTIQSSIGAGAYAALSSAIALAAVDDVGRTANVVAAQQVLGPADSAQAVHAAADVAGIVHLLFYLT